MIHAHIWRKSPSDIPTKGPSGNLAGKTISAEMSSVIAFISPPSITVYFPAGISLGIPGGIYYKFPEKNPTVFLEQFQQEFLKEDNVDFQLQLSGEL